MRGREGGREEGGKGEKEGADSTEACCAVGSATCTCIPCIPCIPCTSVPPAGKDETKPEQKKQEEKKRGGGGRGRGAKNRGGVPT